jgi:hypothetical protein
MGLLGSSAVARAAVSLAGIGQTTIQMQVQNTSAAVSQPTASA